MKKKVLIIGSGISGLNCAIECVNQGLYPVLVSPFPSERSQSVLAAGGINAVIDSREDSIKCHVDDTLKGGCYIAGKEAVEGLCQHAPETVEKLKKLGTVFSVDENGEPSRRAFGGQSFHRTCYCGSSTGKQIVTALVMEARRLEGLGLLERRFWMDFYSALIREGKCYGAILYNEATTKTEAFFADALVVATGGQNALFGKTTGSTQCDGYAAGRLFMQGVELKNLEFIQYHPTTMETGQKNMLISEAARGEGGRLYYEEDGKRVYFMEELYGAKGNLMPRDIVSKCIYETKKQVWLDVACIGKERILKRIPEVYELCLKYRGIDITKESIPILPSVHFFMGGIAVNNHHETNIRNLYAVGECASIYHGANRLGGNSLLAAMYSGEVAAKSIAEKLSAKNISKSDSKNVSENASENASESASENVSESSGEITGNKCVTGQEKYFERELAEAEKHLETLRGSESVFPVMYIRDMLADIMKKHLGIVRNREDLLRGIEDVDYYLSIIDKIHFDRSEMIYFGYSLEGLLNLAKATLTCALSREESRGAHLRSDFPESSEEFAYSTIISYNGGNFITYPDREGKYEH